MAYEIQMTLSTKSNGFNEVLDVPGVESLLPWFDDHSEPVYNVYRCVLFNSEPFLWAMNQISEKAFCSQIRRGQLLCKVVERVLSTHDRNEARRIANDVEFC